MLCADNANQTRTSSFSSSPFVDRLSLSKSINTPPRMLQLSACLAPLHRGGTSSRTTRGAKQRKKERGPTTRHIEPTQTDRQADKRPTDRPADRQTGKPTDGRTDQQMRKEGKQKKLLFGRQPKGRRQISKVSEKSTPQRMGL